MTYEKNSNKLNQDFKQGKIFLVLIILILLILLILYKQQSILILFKAVYEDRQNQQAQELASETLETEENIDLTDNTLILYNENALDSKEIAEYYATKRGISFSQICPIKVPTGMYAEKKHLYGARRKVIENCICALIPIDKKPALCNIDNIDEIAKVSPITHLVFIRGIPARVTGIGDSQDFEEPSFDFFLSYLLYNSKIEFLKIGTEVYHVDTRLPSNYHGRKNNVDDYQTDDSISGRIREINPSLDKMPAYGRIDEITKERAKALIDRTVNVEQQGLSGNFYATLDLYNNVEIINFLSTLKSTRKDECGSNIQNELANTGTWSDETCSVGATKTQIPGESNAEIKEVINPVLYLGARYEGNGHSAFDGFNNMLKWKKEKNCIALCNDFSSENEREACREKSLDYFKEINTECVGTRSLMGWQLRSYPVQYFGFFPKGWTTNEGGASEKTLPIIIQGDSFKNEKFTDDKYLHFGSLDQKENSGCWLEDGTTEICFEIPIINLIKYMSYNIPIDAQKNFNFRLRYRIPKESLGKKINVVIYGRLKNSKTYKVISSNAITLDKSDEWVLKELNFAFNNNLGEEIDLIRLDIYSNFNLRNWIDLDGIELKIDEVDIISIDDGSFSASPYNQVVGGDWASNVIGRIGGVAWWGSSSHFGTGGFSFNNPYRFSGAFFSGRTLGESLIYVGSGWAGIIYGDPLYRPAGVKMYLDNGYQKIYSNNYINPKWHVFSLNTPETGKLYLTAFNGLDGESQWSLSICNSIEDFFPAEKCPEWTMLKEGKGVVFEKESGYTSKDFVTDTTKEQKFILKLRTWRQGDEKSILENYAFFHYVPDVSCEKIACKNFNYLDKNLNCNYENYTGGIEKNYCEQGIYKGRLIENKNFFCTDNRLPSEIGKCTECYSDSDCDDSNDNNGKEFCHVYNEEILTGLCYKFDSEWSKEITNCEQLQLINRNLEENYVLVNDIDCSNSVHWFNGLGFQPIGPNFSGILDGQGHKIKNLKISNSWSNDAGLFVKISKGTIKNLHIENSEIKGKRVGGFSALCYITTISDSSFNGNLIGDNVGGFCGQNYFLNIERSYFKGKIKANKIAAGVSIGNNIVPFLNSNIVTIRDSYVDATIDSKFVSGFIHNATSLNIENSYANITSLGDSAENSGFTHIIISFHADENTARLKELFRISPDFEKFEFKDYLDEIFEDSKVSIKNSFSIMNIQGTTNGFSKNSENINTIENSYVYSPTSCFGPSGTETCSINSLNYFYNYDNEPMKSWDFNIWSDYNKLNYFPQLKNSETTECVNEIINRNLPFCGKGECRRQGTFICSSGKIEIKCEPGIPASEEICDLKDNDCDDQIDEICSSCAMYPNADLCAENEICPGTAIIGDSFLENCCTIECVLPSWNSCSQCGQGLFNTCDREECYGIDEQCYFDTGLINNCISCSNINDCSKYNGEQSCSDDVCGLENCEFVNNKCRAVLCGNNDIDEGEVCDSNTKTCAINGYAGTQTCNQQCTAFGPCQTTEKCGDGIKNGNEECDDGNSENSDGCSVSCRIEAGWLCSGKPSVCNRITNEPVLTIYFPKENEHYKNTAIPIKFTANALSCEFIIKDNTGDEVKRETGCNVDTDVIIKPAQRGNLEHYKIEIIIKDNSGNELKREMVDFVVERTRDVIIQYNEFRENKNTTYLDELSDDELKNIKLILDDGEKIEVEFLEKINLLEVANRNQEKFINLDAYIEISSNSISIDSENISVLNKSARITLKQLTLENPIILKDGVFCDKCTIESYTNSTLMFTVPGFSTYKAVEYSSVFFCGNTICDTGETCSTCSQDCGNCPSSGGSSGGSSSGSSGGSRGGTTPDFSRNITNKTIQNQSSINVTTINNTGNTIENKTTINDVAETKESDKIKLVIGIILLSLIITLIIIYLFQKKRKSFKKPTITL